MSKPLYGGPFQRRRKEMIAQALAHPDRARCWQCEQPLVTCGPNRNGKHRNGKPAKWTAGHTIDGDPNAPLMLECSPCNYSRGAASGNRKRGRGVAITNGNATPEDPAPLGLSDSENQPMTTPTDQPAATHKKRAQSTRKRAKTKKTGTSPRKAQQTTTQPRVCTCPSCGKVCKTPTGLKTHQRSHANDQPVQPAGPPPKETTAAALERDLAGIPAAVLKNRATLVATLRQLAAALDECEPTDKPKTAKELTRLKAELDQEVPTGDDGDDWTDGDPPVGNAPQH